MNLTDFLLMKNGNTVKPDADLVDILLAKKLSGGAGVITTLVGNPLSFLAKKAQYAQSTLLTLSPVQEGSGDPSPTNIRPIFGRSSVTIEGCGKNLLPTFTQNDSDNGLTLTVNADNSVTIDGRATATTVFRADLSTWQWDGITECWLSGCPSGGNYQNTYSLRIDGDGINYSRPDVGNGIKLQPNAAALNITGTPLCFGIIIRNGTVCDNLTFRPMLNFGLSAQPFEPYTESNDVTITIGQTVYGGILDVETGTCVVDRTSLDIGTLTWDYRTDTTKPIFQANIFPKNKPTGSGSVAADAISSMYPVTTSNNVSQNGYDKKFALSADGNRIYIQNSDYTDRYVFKTAMSGVQLVYELATPLTLTLTPEQVSILKGQNNIWIEDEGVVMELTYLA